MGKIKTFTRRTFLITSTAVAGGVAFGTYKYKSELPNPLLKDLKPGDAAVTPFVKIDASGVTLITPRADKGQGVYSLQAHLLAEELDVDPTKVKLSPGVPDAAYYNGVVVEGDAPGLGKLVGKLSGMQITGGSSSTPDMFLRMREAAAAARETIKLAASLRLGVDVSVLKTADAQVIAPDGQTLSYQSLAPDVAKLTPVNDVELRPESEWKYLGKNIRRLDIVAKSTGTQTYGIDLAFDNMLYASVRANPGMGGAVNRVDDSAAKNMRGVKKVVPVAHGVAVIADNTWRAFNALKAINIDWGAPNYPKSSAEMWQVLEDHAKPEFQNIQGRSDGDADAALQNNDTAAGDIVSREFRAPYLAHAPLEPMNAVVLYGDDRLDIWTGTQIPRFVVEHASKLANVSEDNVHLHVQVMGGSFGRRLELTYVMQAIEIAMAVKGQPVKMTWTREEDMAHDYPRPMSLAKAQGRVLDGKIDTIKLDMISPSLMASWMSRLATALPGPDATLIKGANDQPFAVPNYQVTGFRAPELAPISSWRSVAPSQNGFFHEAFFDELATKAGADPLAERLRLCSDSVAKKVLEEIGRLTNWNGTNIGANRGRGLAFIKSFGVPVAQVIDVSVTDHGIRIDDVFLVADVGKVLDPINIEAQFSGGAIWALGHAMNCELTYENYTPVQTNFHKFQAMRMHQTPTIHIKVMEHGDKILGAGEPAVPPAAPALANAIFAATGVRLQEMPFDKTVSFV